MKYHKKQEWKKRILSIVALIMAVIMVLGMIAPFTIFAASVERVVTTTTVPMMPNGGGGTAGGENYDAQITLSGAKEIGADRFKAEVVAGYDGTYIVDQTMPVTGVITNLGETFRGEVQVKAYTQNTGDGKKFVVYFQKLELGKGASKTIDMEVSMGSIHKNLELSLVDEKGNTVFLKNISLKAKNPKTVLVGILTGQKEEMNHIKNLHLVEAEDGYGVAMDGRNFQMTTFLTEDTFPNTIGKMNAFDTVFVEDFDTFLLSEKQKNALTQWVNRGGTLVVGTGVNAKKTLKGLDLTQGITIAGTKEATGISGIATPVTIANLSGERLEGVIAKEGHTLFSQEPKGRGRMLLAHFAFSVAPMAGTEVMLQLLEDALVQVQGSREIIRPNEQSWQQDSLRYNAQKFPAMEQNSIMFIMVLIGIYIFMAGPVLYIILKKRDMREKGWVIIPGLSFVFMVVVFLVAKGSGYQTGMLRTVSVVEMAADSPMAIAEVGIAVKTPATGDVTFTSSEQLFVNTEEDDGYYTLGEEVSREQGTHRILCGETTEVTFLDSPSWGDQYFSTQAVLDLGGTIESTIAVSEAGYIGTLVNKTNVDYSDVTLMIGEYFYRFSDFKAGETKEISLLHTESQESIWDTYGGGYQYEAREQVRQGEITRSQAFRIVRRESLREDIYYEMETGALMPIQFFGYEDKAPILGEMRVDGKKLLESAMTMYHQEIPLIFSEEGAFSFPLSGTEYSDQKIDVYQNGMGKTVVAMEDSEVNVSFLMPRDVTVKTITPIQAEEGGMMPEVMELLNLTTGAWDTVILEEGVDAAPYINEIGKVTLRFRVPMDQDREIPQLMLTGGGQGA